MTLITSLLRNDIKDNRQTLNEVKEYGKYVVGIGVGTRAAPCAGAGGFLDESKVLCARGPAHTAGPRGRFSKGLKSRAPARAYFQNAQKRGHLVGGKKFGFNTDPGINN